MCTDLEVKVPVQAVHRPGEIALLHGADVSDVVGYRELCHAGQRGRETLDNRLGRRPLLRQLAGSREDPRGVTVGVEAFRWDGCCRPTM